MRVLTGVVFLSVAASLPADQPLPFSHKTHSATAKLACADCHPTPVKFGQTMGYPAASKCMACHILIAREKPAIEKLAALAKSAEPVPWVRVYKLPDFVFFDHRFHLLNEATCADCHGAVAERDVITNEPNATKMTFCQSCHVKMKANNGCAACHNYR